MAIDPSAEMYGSSPDMYATQPDAPATPALAANKPPPVQFKAKSSPTPEKISLTAGGKVGARHGDTTRLQAMTAGLDKDINKQPGPPPQFKGIPYKPEPLIPKEQFSKMVGMSLLFAALAGKSSGQPMIASLNAFTGAMQGSLQGRHEVVAEHLDEWKAQSKQAMDSFQAQTDNYWNIINDNHKRIDEKLRETNIQAHVVHDEQITALQGNFQGILGVLNQRGAMLKGLNAERNILIKSSLSGLLNAKQQKEVTDRLNANQAEISRQTALQDERLSRIDVTDVPGSTAGLDVNALIEEGNQLIASGQKTPEEVRAKLKRAGIEVQ